VKHTAAVKFFFSMAVFMLEVKYGLGVGVGSLGVDLGLARTILVPCVHSSPEL